MNIKIIVDKLIDIVSGITLSIPILAVPIMADTYNWLPKESSKAGSLLMLGGLSLIIILGIIRKIIIRRFNIELNNKVTELSKLKNEINELMDSIKYNNYEYDKLIQKEE